MTLVINENTIEYDNISYKWKQAENYLLVLL